jgi:hypothetical protein
VKPSEKENTAQDRDRLIVDQLLRKLRRATPAALRRTSTPAAAPQSVMSSVERAVERAVSYPTGTVGVVGTVGSVGSVGTAAPVLRRPAAMRTMRSSRAVGIWARAILGVCLGIALMQWPYGRACGPRLFFYLTAVTALFMTGLWAAVFAWRGRLGAAHAIALVIMLWGLVLAADEVLPRSGYARYSATWWCADFGAQTDGRQRIALWSLSPN